MPAPARQQVDYAGRRGWFSLGGYVRGQVIIAFIHAVTITILLFILRIPLAAALGVLIFLGSFIPILGLTISGALCVGVALLEHGVGAAIIVAIAIIVLVQIEGHLLQPIIMSRAVHIHPLAVVLAVAAGTVDLRNRWRAHRRAAGGLPQRVRARAAGGAPGCGGRSRERRQRVIVW